MKEKDFISNDCQLCDYSAKQYLCIRNKFSLQKATLCMNLSLSQKDRKKRIKDQEKCDCFKPAPIPQIEELNDIKIMLNTIQEELNVVAQRLALVNKTDE